MTSRPPRETILMNAKIRPKVVQERFGHSTIGTTMDIYSHVPREMDVAVALGRQFDVVA